VETVLVSEMLWKKTETKGNNENPKRKGKKSKPLTHTRPLVCGHVVVRCEASGCW
jgi:hypothetical protein